jgi:hypothetical protein
MLPFLLEIQRDWHKTRTLPSPEKHQRKHSRKNEANVELTDGVFERRVVACLFDAFQGPNAVPCAQVHSGRHPAHERNEKGQSRT